MRGGQGWEWVSGSFRSEGDVGVKSAVKVVQVVGTLFDRKCC